MTCGITGPAKFTEISAHYRILVSKVLGLSDEEKNSRDPNFMFVPVRWNDLKMYISSNWVWPDTMIVPEEGGSIKNNIPPSGTINYYYSGNIWIADSTTSEEGTFLGLKLDKGLKWEGIGKDRSTYLIDPQKLGISKLKIANQFSEEIADQYSKEKVYKISIILDGEIIDTQEIPVKPWELGDYTNNLDISDLNTGEHKLMIRVDEKHLQTNSYVLCDLVEIPPFEVKSNSKLGMVEGGKGKVLERSGQITSVIWPTKDTYNHTEPIPVNINFTNTGSQAQSFWIGYSVQDSTGNWWDAPTRQAAATKPGESGSLELEWKPPEDAPQGAYTAKVALWEGSNFDTGLMEGEFDSRTKDNAFQLNPVQAINVPQDLATSESNNNLSALVLLLKGKEPFDQGKYEEALQIFDKAIELDPNLALAWGLKGYALLAQAKYDEALQAANKTLELNSSLAEAWALKGMVLSILGKNSEAEAAASRAKELGYSKEILINNENAPRRPDSKPLDLERITIKDFVGAWINEDTSTLPKIDITQDGENLDIRTWGACAPTYCDQGSVKVHYDGNSIKYTRSTSFKDVTNELDLLPDGRLHLHTVNVFTDGRDDWIKDCYYYKLD